MYVNNINVNLSYNVMLYFGFKLASNCPSAAVHLAFIDINYRTKLSKRTSFFCQSIGKLIVYFVSLTLGIGKVLLGRDSNSCQIIF